MNDNDPQRLTGSGTIRKHRLVGVGVALLEEVSPQGWALRFQKLEPSPESVPADLDVEPSAPSPALSACVLPIVIIMN